MLYIQHGNTNNGNVILPATNADIISHIKHVYLVLPQVDYVLDGEDPKPIGIYLSEKDAIEFCAKSFAIEPSEFNNEDYMYYVEKSKLN